ncbi:hypothetical protein BUALT_Bualt16G0107500 [Buddleja alternifolia]|uniref:Uncharacterized protein n=1 Tax=Buddleja alternifolia TaxID=168488 RepID=A0AAV6WJW5_9LAMI|nr:hypothetical protein BUALT_Bualt16G0107500 [Buddleja alternifolia]
MVYTSSSTYFFFALLLLAIANYPLAHGIGISFSGLSVSGQLCCTSTRNCPSQGVGGVVVQLNCTILGTSTTVGQATTNATGSFNITTPAITGLILGQPLVPCVASVQLPLEAAVCPLLSTTNGALVSTVQSVGTLATNVFGLVQNAILSGFTKLLA